MSWIDDEIMERLGLDRLLLQLAEECNELSKASLKLERVLDGSNPTPKTEDEATADLIEEAADVYCVLSLILSAENNMEIYNIIQEKKDRWLNRLEERDLHYGGWLEMTEEHLRGIDEEEGNGG